MPCLLAAETCQLGGKLQCTSLMPAFRCCRLTHPRTIKLTRSWLAQTRAGMAWGKALLVSSSWLIPCGYAVNRTDIQTSYTELKLCFTSAGVKVVSHPCNYTQHSDPFIFLEDLVSYVTYVSSYPVVGDFHFPSMSLTSAYRLSFSWHLSVISWLSMLKFRSLKLIPPFS